MVAMTGPAEEKARRTPPAKCRTCNRPMNSPLMCDSCRTLYPADGLSHFQLFGLMPTFDVDTADLRRRYLQLSRDAHPDHRGHESDSSVSLQVSAQLNEAHRVLSDPLLRAEYLLELFGGPSSAQDKSVTPDVLNETFMLREAITEARAGGDHAALDDCRRRVEQARAAGLAEIARLARTLPGNEDNRRALRAALNASKYYTKLLAET
jgi:molecular chaperone HscB